MPALLRQSHMRDYALCNGDTRIGARRETGLGLHKCITASLSRSSMSIYSVCAHETSLSVV